MKKRSLMLVLAFMLVFASAFIPTKSVSAKSNPCWYGKYSELSKDAEKAIKFKKGDKVTLKGKFTCTAGRHAWDAKEHRINKTFRFTKNTRFYVDDSCAEKNPVRRISKNKFKEFAHFDVSHSAFKVKSGRVIKAVVSIN